MKDVDGCGSDKKNEKDNDPEDHRASLRMSELRNGSEFDKVRTPGAFAPRPERLPLAEGWRRSISRERPSAETG